MSLFAADNKSLGFDDQQILTDYFQLWKDLIDAGAAPNPDEYEQIATLGNEASPVITGDAAFQQSWDNFANIGTDAGNDTLELLVPPVKEAGQAALWYKPGMFFSVAETSEVKEECAKFIDWFVNSDEANDIIMGERGTPASSSARDYLVGSGKLSGKQAEMFNFATEAADYCGETPAPDPTGISEINTYFKDIAYSVFYGQATPAEAAATVLSSRQTASWPPTTDLLHGEGEALPLFIQTVRRFASCPRQKRPPRPGTSGRGGSDLRTGYLLLAPWLFGFVFMYLVPAVMSIYYSFTNYNLLSAPDWVGLDNYIQIFTQDQNFRQAMSVTFRYVFIMVPLRLAFALFVAHPAEQKAHGHGLLPGALLYPLHRGRLHRRLGGLEADLRQLRAS